MYGVVFSPPSISDLFPPAVLFPNTPFAIDRLTVVKFVMVLAMLSVFIIAAAKAKLVPRGIQNVVEVLIDFVRIHIAEEIIGAKHAKQYLTILTAIFSTVLFLNISSVIPFLNISSNARIAMPLVMAVFSFFVFIFVGIKNHGFTYFKKTVVVSGVPKAMHILLIPMEILSNFILRPFTLTVRLMANMLSGHMLLVLFFAATDYFFYASPSWLKVFSAGTLAISLLFTLFEIMIAFLQAYIFTLLVAVYIDSSIHADEH